MVGVFLGEKATGLVNWLAIGVIALAGIVLVSMSGSGVAYGGAFLADPFARFMKVLTLLGSAIALFMTVGQAKLYYMKPVRISVLILLATLGMMLMVSANNMMSLYMALELQSLAAYVVAAMNRDDVRSTEAPEVLRARRPVLGHAALWHLAGLWLYRQTGFPEIAAFLSAGGRFARRDLRPGVHPRRRCLQDLAVPFHMWTPDVYQARQRRSRPSWPAPRMLLRLP